MPENLEELLSHLDSGEEIAVDYDAPEAGVFPPQVYPGPHEFVFHLAKEGAFDKITVDGKDYLNVTFSAEIQLPEKAEPVTVNFLRASAFKSPKAPAGTNSDVGELLRCLGIRLESHKATDIAHALQQADGRARGRAVFGWEAYCKSCEEVVATSPQKKPRKNGHTDVAWPKGADGRYEMVVKCPSCGDSMYGRERISRGGFKLPKDGAAAA